VLLVPQDKLVLQVRLVVQVLQVPQVVVELVLQVLVG
jgi:hypothetical protein